MNLTFLIILSLVLLFLGWLFPRLAKDHSDLQDEIEKNIDSNRVESFLKETSQT